MGRDARPKATPGGPEFTAAVSLGDIGVFHDPLEFYRSPACRARFPRIARLMRWNLLTASVEKAVTELRAEPDAGLPRRVSPNAGSSPARR